MQPINSSLMGAIDGLLSRAYMDGISIASNAAREQATALSAAASLGLLTTENADGSFGRVWRPTTAGYLWVRENRERSPL